MDAQADPPSSIDHIPIGYVRRAHGIRGDVVVRGLVSDAGDRFTAGSVLSTEEPDTRSFRVTAVSPHKGDYILGLDGVDLRDEAESLVGTRFVIPHEDRRTLDDDEWWAEDLIGCSVVAVDGSEVGIVTDVVVGAAQDRITVTAPDGSVAEVPFVDALVPMVDPTTRRIVVDLPAGLFPDPDGPVAT